MNEVKVASARKLVRDSLQEILDLLKGGNNVLAVDQIAVMWLGETDGKVIFTFSAEHEQHIELDVLWQLFSQAINTPHGVIVELDGQHGADFDFCVAIGSAGNEYIVFGNYLAGTMEDLQASPEWEICKSLFVVMASRLVKLLTA